MGCHGCEASTLPSELSPQPWVLLFDDPFCGQIFPPPLRFSFLLDLLPLLVVQRGRSSMGLQTPLPETTQGSLRVHAWSRGEPVKSPSVSILLGGYRGLLIMSSLQRT